MKPLYHTLRIIFGLLLFVTILGGFGLLPQPTADMYTPDGWAYMSALMNTGYMMPFIATLNLVVAILLFMNRTAMAAIMMLPFTVNVILFHLFLDAAPVSASAIPAYLLVAFNLYFIWVNWNKYKMLFAK